MLHDFDQLKAQLKELAEVVNAFKSEAVQLRIVELALAGASKDPAKSGAKQAAPKKPRLQRKSKPTDALPGAKAQRKPKATARPGGWTTLARLQGEGFFKKPRTIGELVQHADTNMALKLKQSDFSGALARYVRDGKLKRSKNAESQYQYTEP